jgi:hypothetical protein
MSLESSGTAQEETYSFTMTFRIFDRDALDDALNDLKSAEVWADDEGPDDNTIEENLEILVEHLDVLATYRERDNIAYTDIGIERVAQ